jgi:hypothetical protein
MVDMKWIEKALRVHSLLILDNEGLPAMTIERDYLEQAARAYVEALIDFGKEQTREPDRVVHKSSGENTARD